MKLTTSQDIEAPIEHVFDAVTDFDGFAKQAMRRGADVRRVDSQSGKAAGMIWDAAFDFRGKRRQMKIDLAEYDAPNGLLALSTMPGMSGTLKMELLALSRGRTRLGIELEMAPQTLSARLLVQSLKLARGALSKRMDKRLAEFARQTEESYARSA